MICGPAIIAILFTILAVKIHKLHENKTIKNEKLLIAYLSIASAVFKSISGICYMMWATPDKPYYAFI